MIEFTHGDLFAASTDIRINTVNCVGVMGAGAALAFKQRYPEMFREYRRACKHGLVRPGAIHVWRSLSGDWIVNFPTKRNWKDRSRYEDIDSGLDALREYLIELGPVSVAMPALGCGHGGLDWRLVSKMIENKLHDIEAHVLVFAPSDSRQAGHVAATELTDAELRSIELLGYQKLPDALAKEFGVSGTAFAKGQLEILKKQWIAVLPSRAPGERERGALHAIAAEIAKHGAAASVGLLYSTRATEEVAQLFAGHRIETIMLLPFGILTRKAVSRLASSPGVASITLASTVQPNAKWSQFLVAKTMEQLRRHAAAILISDPEPEWFFKRVAGQGPNPPIFYLRYDGFSEALQDVVTNSRASAIGRRASSGAPNLDALLAAYETRRAEEIRSTIQSPI
jgi:O-acetyl-ADP-ribose deacetylase (regulator of RNase III)